MVGTSKSSGPFFALMFAKVETTQRFLVSQLLISLDHFFCPQNTGLGEGVSEGVVCLESLQPLGGGEKREIERARE